MAQWLKSFGLGLALTSALAPAAIAPAAIAQETHLVRLDADPAKDEYRFDPAVVTVRANDVVVFRVGSGAPHSVVFEAAGLSSGVHTALNAALTGRTGDLSGPLLTSTGTEYRLVVPALPAGTYRFFCLPHRAYDMRGELRVK